MTDVTAESFLLQDADLDDFNRVMADARDVIDSVNLMTYDYQEMPISPRPMSYLPLREHNTTLSSRTPASTGQAAASAANRTPTSQEIENDLLEINNLLSSIGNNVPVPPPRRTTRSVTAALPEAQDIIDLSNTQQWETPSRQQQQQPMLNPALNINNADDGDDDDVILILDNNVLNRSAAIVDLCTPVRRATTPAVRRFLRAANLSPYRPALPRSRLPPNVNVRSNHNPDLDLSQSPTESGAQQPGICAVCMESALRRQPTTTKCGHVFCYNCIQRAIQISAKCPLCNKKLNRSSLVRLYL